ncbi:MAG: DUF4259 domain-containing protein [Phycisphaerae bacterium]|nr:DUF4259 domain-containing protein [Phycisphaerae bacterium]
MAAWGTGAFENDDSLDWADMFAQAEESGFNSDDPDGPGAGLDDEEDGDEDLSKEDLLTAPLLTCNDAPAGEPIDAELAAHVVAASEVVAALFGKPGAELLAAVDSAGDEEDDDSDALAEIARWIASTDSPVRSMPRLGRVAHEALDRVLASELNDLWAETDHHESWRASIRDLRSRLG